MKALQIEAFELEPLSLQSKSKRFEKVFIVDDRPMDRQRSENFLRSHDFADDITGFDSAREALNYICSAERLSDIPEIIFLSLDMKGMSGYEFIKKFSQLSDFTRKRCNIIILTNEMNEEARKKCLIHRSVGQYYVKPLNHNHLTEFTH